MVRLLYLTLVPPGHTLALTGVLAKESMTGSGLGRALGLLGKATDAASAAAVKDVIAIWRQKIASDGSAPSTAAVPTPAEDGGGTKPQQPQTTDAHWNPYANSMPEPPVAPAKIEAPVPAPRRVVPIKRPEVELLEPKVKELRLFTI